MAESEPSAITAQDAQGLQAKLRGRVLTSGDPDYDTARKVFNGMIDRRPAAIARCNGTADVMRALEFGIERGSTISVRCGGHSIPGFGVCDGGVMIDLSEMNGVYVDTARQTARVEGGANWGQFDHETEAFGLATTGGLVRTTGIAGLTLSGGHGFLMRKFGLACDNLLSADVVTAGGQVVRASASENHDLFWALRGGGGNFGVVTSFEYRLHALGPVLGGLLLFPIGEARKVLKFYDEYAASAPDELGVLAALGTLPDGTKAVVHPVCYAGDLTEGGRALEPLRKIAAPLMDQVQPMPYTAVQSIVENFNPRGFRNYWKMVYLSELSSSVIDVMTGMYERRVHPLTHIVVYTLGGAVSRVGPDETAVSYRDSRHAVIAIGVWDNPAQDEFHIAWVREFARALQPFASGGFYPNYDSDVAGDQIVSAFGPQKYARLAAIKQKYDPNNVFRLNQNIRPA